VQDEIRLLPSIGIETERLERGGFLGHPGRRRFAERRDHVGVHVGEDQWSGGADFARNNAGTFRRSWSGVLGGWYTCSPAIRRRTSTMRPAIAAAATIGAFIRCVMASTPCRPM